MQQPEASGVFQSRNNVGNRAPVPDQFGDSAEGLAVAAGCLTSWSAGVVADKLAAVLQAIDDHHGRV